MKIAILFSGRIQFFEKSYPNIMKNIVQGNHVDFFISYPKDTDINMTNDFLEIFEPKVFIESDEKYFRVRHVPKRCPGTNTHNTMCMYLNRKNVCELFKKYIKENKISYDLVISYRVDYFLSSKLDLQLLKNKSKQNLLCIPSGKDYHGLNDQMAIGNTETMIQYMSCYDTISELFKRGTIMHPETILHDYVKYKKMNTFRFPLETSIIRK